MRQRRWTFTTLTASSGVAGLLITLMVLGRLFGPAQPAAPKADVVVPGDSTPTPSPPPAGPPRLAILLVFDQLSADYLTRWDSLFEEGGFHRLEQEGAWFTNCNYPYALTVTAAGHASLATGCSPDRHGIVANDWYDRATGKVVNCVSGDERITQVPPGIVVPGKEPSGRVSPRMLQAQTLSDSLKEATGDKGRVVSLSFKDRGACLPGGKHPDACYWFDNGIGSFVTSTWYRDAPHAWVRAFNETRPANQYLGKVWTLSRPVELIERFSGPDDVKGEGLPNIDKSSRVFPHPVNSHDALYASPFGNEMLLELVKQAIDAEQLGRRETPDLLCVSFSSNDAVGHAWGPDSQEVLDMTLRTDRLIKDLLTFLDSHVGKGRYTIVLSADHGVCPLPEVAPKPGEPMRQRVDDSSLPAEAEAFLNRVFPGPAGIALDNVRMDQTPFFYLNKEWMKARNLPHAEAESALGGWLAGRPETLIFHTRTCLERGIPATDVIGQRVLKSFYKDRSGDVYMVTRPYHLLNMPGTHTGTSHGTPHLYDTHVPLIAFGPGIKPGKREDAITPQAAAPILAQALGVPAPKEAEAVVPSQLFRGPP